MKKRTFLQKLCAIFTVSALLLGTGSAIAPAVSAAAEPDSWHDDWLHVNDNAEIVDRNGNPVWLTGCNWFGYNVGSQVFDGVWSQNMHEMLTQIADHGFNLLRIPVSTELLLQWKNGDPDPATPKVNEWTNPELTKEGVVGGTVKYSFDIWNQAIAWCRELGIKIMIDIHSAETASAGHQVNLWYTDKFSTEDWFEALSWFADYYKDDDTILAIDLKNEPHGKADVPDKMAKWDDTTDPNNWKYAAEQAAAHVLKENPNLLVMVEGVEVYPKEGYDWTAPAIDWTTNTEYYYGTWWGGNFRGAKENPIDLGEYQSQLVYSPHDYGPLVYQQKWFYEGFTKETLLKDCWYDNWFYLLDEKVAPLLMGEWGGFIDSQHDPDGSNQKWMLALRTLIRPPSPVILFTWVHGLTWEDLRNAPTFPEVWPEMASFMDGASGLVAHNATFDRSVLYGCCESFGCPYPGLPFYDTLKGARRSLPPGSKSLDHVCSYFQIKLNHHQALSDAEACARIFVELQKRGLDAASMRLKSAGRPRARLPLGPDHPSPVR